MSANENSGRITVYTIKNTLMEEIKYVSLLIKQSINEIGQIAIILIGFIGVAKYLKKEVRELLKK